MRIGLWACGLLFLLGCGDGSGKVVEVSGTVLMDGVPLEEGDILFEAPDLSSTPGGGKIEKGKYRIKVSPGPKKVKITASRSTGVPDPVMGMAAQEPALGPEYNLQTTLTHEVTTSNQDNVNFEVKELPKKKKK
jgi:hypothetical protein